MNKRGQIFLIAALVIIALISGFYVVYNSTRTYEEKNTIFDLSDEIEFESAEVIDNGVYNGKTEEQVNEYIKDLTDFYIANSPDHDFIFIYGNASNITIRLYECKERGGSNLAGAGFSFCNMTDEWINTADISADSDIVNVTFSGGLSYNFKIKEGRFFYIVVKKYREEGTDVATSERPQGLIDENEIDENEIAENETEEIDNAFE